MKAKRTFALVILIAMALSILMAPGVVTNGEARRIIGEPDGRPSAIYIDPNADNPEHRVTFVYLEGYEGTTQIWIKMDGVWTPMNG